MCRSRSEAFVSPPATGSWRTRTAASSFLELAEDVLEEAEAMAATENEIRAAVREGATPLEAYEQFGTF